MNKYYFEMVDKDYKEPTVFDNKEIWEKFMLETNHYIVEIEAPTKTQAIFKRYAMYPDFKLY